MSLGPLAPIALGVGMGLDIIGGVFSAGQARRGGRAQAAWHRYNADMAYKTAMGNIEANMAIAKMNAGIAMAEGNIEAALAKALSTYNANMTWRVALYNDQLFEEELRLLWKQNELDLKLLEEQRAMERGEIVATQAASGTVIGVGSNEDVIVSQMTQEALDATIIRHGADIQAARISNERAKSLWQGATEAQAILYEGKLSAAASLASANAAAAGQLGGAAIQAAADYQSAQYAKEAGYYGADFAEYMGNAKANNIMNNAFFSAAGKGVSMAAMWSPSPAGKDVTPGIPGVDVAPYTGKGPMTPGIPGVDVPGRGAITQTPRTQIPTWAWF